MKDEAFKLGRCYELSGNHVLFIDRAATLVHGIIHGQGQIAGFVFGHAWVEKDGLVLNPFGDDLINMTLDDFNARAVIDRTLTVSYDFEQAREQVLKWQHWGPWNPALFGISLLPASVLHEKDFLKTLRDAIAEGGQG